MQDAIKVPKARIAVIIGEKGKIKRDIQEKTNTIITIDSKEGDATIDGDDGLNVLLAKNIIQAIARGFNPEIAMRLLEEDMCFEKLELTDFCRNKNDIKRVKSRVIGTDGKARRMIESLTNTNIVVFGKTVCIIGGLKESALARKALISLLQGSKHGSVYSMVDRERKKKRSS